MVKNITMDELLTIIDSLPYNKFKCKMKHYRQLALWSLVSEILKQPNIDEIIYKLLADDRHYKIDEEDLEAIKAGRYI